MLLCVLMPAAGFAGQAMLLESVAATDAAVVAPARLVLRFDRRVEARVSSVVLVGGARQTRILLTLPGAPGSDTLVYPLPDLTPGQYRAEPGQHRAEWKVLPLGGLATEGVVRFTVLEVAR
jgi:methionine-rich copper-binding protein CopC